MKKLSVLLLASTILFACHKKSVPAASAKDEKAPVSAVKPAEIKAEKPDASYLAAGQTIFESSCKRCHGLKKTENYTQQRWVGIMNSMAPKARLNDDEKAKVLAFVQSRAKDATTDR